MTEKELLKLVRGVLHYGEPDPVDLPDDTDELLAIHDKLNAIRAACMTLRQVTDEKVAQLIGPGQPYEYGDHVVSWRHGYKYKATPEAADVVAKICAADHEAVKDLFNMNAIRKTGLERVAARNDFPVTATVETVLEKVWDDAPRLQFKPKDA